MSDKPRRRIVVSVNIGADTWEDIAQTLEQMAFEVGVGYLRSSATSGAPSAGYNWHAHEDPTITHESYFKALEAYLRSDAAVKS